MALKDIQLLKKRANDHWQAALVLASAQNEWAAVAAFYSCFQLARASFLMDPVFDNFAEMKLAHQHLTPDDRYADKHQVRKGSHGFGMVDLVQILYKHVGKNYRVLHQGSVQVRYENGLRPPYNIQDLMDLSQEFQDEFHAGHLIHSRAKELLPTDPEDV